MGATGGADTTTLNANNLPAHTHPVTDPGHAHTVTAMSQGNEGTNGAAFGRLGNNQPNATDTVQTGITVGSNATTNTPVSVVNPYIVLQYIIKF
jgi:microcystin-dependent protein